MIARSAVSDDLQVSVVVYGIVSSGNATVSVEVLVHYVACSPSASESRLSLSQFRRIIAICLEEILVQPVQVCVHLLLAFCYANGLISPYFAEFSSRDVLPYGARGVARIFRDYGL